MKREVMRETFDRFVGKHNLMETWADGLFGYDKERAEQKYLDAWNALIKLLDDGQKEVRDGLHMEFLLRRACGLPCARSLHFHKDKFTYANRDQSVKSFHDNMPKHARRHRERVAAADAKLRQIMRADKATNPPQPSP